MSRRIEALLAQLEDEAALGYPKPWYRQDQIAAMPWDQWHAHQFLDRYIDLLGDAHTEARKESNVVPMHRRAA